ncbi:MAG: hypothetical protein M1839_003951 [Geoglossum umbratile]|nr:MAG: hypothetical protein M1839_003951 [Geoglossum umbratile]
MSGFLPGEIGSGIDTFSWLIGTRRNTGSFQWNVELRGLFTDPQWLVLRSNDSAYSDQYIRSDVYYVEPPDYDYKQSSYIPGPYDGIIYPAGDPMPVFRINDTVVVEWTPGPLYPKIAAIGDGQAAFEISDPLARNATSLVWVLHNTEGMYANWLYEISPGIYRLNLYDTPSSGADSSNDKLLYKSPRFEVKSASGSPTTWRATVTSTLSTSPSTPTASQGPSPTSIAGKSKQRLSTGGKVGTGVGVGVLS